MRPRWQKVFADLWGNKTRSLLVVASITVGLYAVGIISSLNVILNEDMRGGYAAMDPANLHISIAAFDDRLVDKIRDLPYVKDAEGRRSMTLRYRNNKDEWDRIEIHAIPEIEDMAINRVKPMDGTWPPVYRGIAIDQSDRKDVSAALGEMIQIQLPGGKVRELSLTGIVHDQTIGATGGGGGYFVAPVNAYITTHTLDWLEQPSYYNTLLVTTKTGQTDETYLRDISASINKEIEDYGAVVMSTVVRKSTSHPNSVYIDALTGILFALGLLVLFLSGFLITNTLSALMTQQIKQIGVMKTIGARRVSIITIYMVLIALYGAIAFAIAIPTANWSAFGLTKFLSGPINFDVQGYRPIYQTIIIQAVLALIVPQIAAFFPIFSGANIKTVHAINGGQEMSNLQKKGWIDRKINQIKGIPHPMLISLRNTFRHKGRLVLTLFTLTLGGSIFIATFNVQGALTSYIEKVSKYFIADVSLTMSTYYRIDQVKQDLSAIPDVGIVEGWTYAGCEMLEEDDKPGEPVEMLGVDPESKLITPIIIEGRWVIPGDENAIVLSELFLSAYPDLDIGDTIKMRVNGNNSEWRVVGFFQLAGKSTGFRAYGNYFYLSRFIGSPDKAISFQISSKYPDRNIDQQREFGSRIEKYMRARGYKVASTNSGLFALSSSTEGLNILTTFLLIMACLTALVGAIGLMGTMSMNVMDRTREIGIMRAIGASDRTIMSLVIVEGLLIGLISWLLGCLLSFPISNLLNDILSQAIFDAPSVFSISPAGFIIWLLLVIILAVLASVAPARNAARLTIREVLSYE
ncbi:MAG: ABC transporter permease [Leptolinea sp.]|nr:ABC transporter permease [Leptolinea sp.]